MPVKVAKRGGKYRLVEADSGNIAKTSKGNAMDGGTSKAGSQFADQRRRQRQANRINSSL